jgi:hypothetical protein
MPEDRFELNEDLTVKWDDAPTCGLGPEVEALLHQARALGVTLERAYTVEDVRKVRSELAEVWNGLRRLTMKPALAVSDFGSFERRYYGPGHTSSGKSQLELHKARANPVHFTIEVDKDNFTKKMDDIVKSLTAKPGIPEVPKILTPEGTPAESTVEYVPPYSTQDALTTLREGWMTKKDALSYYYGKALEDDTEQIITGRLFGHERGNEDMKDPYEDPDPNDA